METITEYPNLDPLLLSILSYLPKDSLPAVNKLILTNNTFRNKRNYRRIYQVPNNAGTLYKGPFTPVSGYGNVEYFNINGVTDQNGKIDYDPELVWNTQPPGQNQFGISLKNIKPAEGNLHPQVTVNYNLHNVPGDDRTKFDFYMLRTFRGGTTPYKVNGKDLKKPAPTGDNQSLKFDLPTNAEGFGLYLKPYFYKDVTISSIGVDFVT